MMRTPLEQKSSTEKIKKRFDNDVERFSNLETGQTATIDAPLAMELIAQAAVRLTGRIRKVLDIGCGAGAAALLISRQLEWVVATDINPRALEFLENQIVHTAAGLHKDGRKDRKRSSILYLSRRSENAARHLHGA